LAQQIGLSISPPILEVTMEPGKQITKAYEITNESDRPLYLIPKIVTFVPKDLNGNIQLRQQSQNNIFSLNNSNLDLGQAFKLNANTSQQLVLKINIPENYPQKDLYQTFLIEQTDKGGFVNQSGGKSLIKIGSNILLSVNSNINPPKQAEIEQFTPQPRFADLFDAIKFKIIAHNSSQHFFKTYGQVEINHLWFNQTKNLNLLPENVLSQSSRQVSCAQIDPKKENDTQSAEVTTCQFSSWLPGPYQARLTLSPENSEPVSEKVVFYLIPYRAIFALIIMGILIWQITNQLKNKQI
jgi:hypothetical protein